MKMIKAIVGVSAAAFCIAATAAPLDLTSASPSMQAVQAWHQDLEFIKSKVLAMHPNPFRRISRTQFDDEANQLDQRFPQLGREQAIVGIMKLIASLHDGHTSVLPGPQSRAGFHVLPLRFYLYGDDLVLDGADRTYAAALGGKLTAINGVSASEVIHRVREVTPGDNPSTVDGRLPSYVVVPEVLAGLGVISPNAASVTVNLQLNGKAVSIAVAPILPPQSFVPPSVTLHYTSAWVDRAPAALPTWLSHAAKPYWFTYLPTKRALYLQYNSAANDASDPMPKFAERLTDEIVRRQPERIIVDLRLNSGGEGYWNRVLIRALLRSAAAGQKGKFFVLIGRQTFSAGNTMVVELEKYAAVTFVGEPSGGSVQGFGNHEPVFLPNSGLGVMIATKFYQNDGPNDDRPAIVPEIAATVTPEDYAAGRDPVLNAALRN
jgi:hypothetical protein